MQVLATLYKRTKDGNLSAWNFCVVEETQQCFAIGGGDLKVISALDKKHLRNIYQSFIRYGYKTEVPAKKMLISDPWESQLPLEEQLLLDSLSSELV